MKKNRTHLLIILGLTLALTALSFYQWQKTTPPTTQPPAITTLTPIEYTNQAPNLINLAPEQTAEVFYNWYLQYEGNPLAEGAYLETNLLSIRLKQAIQEQFEGDQPSQLDPLLLAQDLPSGFRIADAILENELATIKIALEYDQTEVFRQVDLVKQDSHWQIDQVQMIEGLKRVSDDDQMEVIVYFSNNEKAPEASTDCSLVYGTPRQVEFSYDVEIELAATLSELFKGPTAQEREQGFSSHFSEKTKGLLNQVKVVDATAYIDLAVDLAKDNHALTSQNASCAGAALLAQIQETILHHRELQTVVISTNGSAQDFYHWLQLDCEAGNNYCQTVFGE